MFTAMTIAMLTAIAVWWLLIQRLKDKPWLTQGVIPTSQEGITSSAPKVGLWVFLAVVSSLFGLLLGWLLAVLAVGGHFAAAALLPLYYLADATITLLRRLVNREPVMQAHRCHFYQRARDVGFSVKQIVARVFALNVALGFLALLTVLNGSTLLDVAAFVIGLVLVGLLLAHFSRSPV